MRLTEFAFLLPFLPENISHSETKNLHMALIRLGQTIHRGKVCGVGSEEQPTHALNKK